MQIEGEAEGKGAPAHIVDGKRLGEARDAVKTTNPSMASRWPVVEDEVVDGDVSAAPQP